MNTLLVNVLASLYDPSNMILERERCITEDTMREMTSYHRQKMFQNIVGMTASAFKEIQHMLCIIELLDSFTDHTDH